MAWPIAAKIGVGALGGFSGWKLYRHFFPKLQSLRHVNKDGHPIQVVVPVDGVRPMMSVSNVPIPHGNGTMAIHRPSPPTPFSNAVQHEPTVITPAGAANLTVNSTSDAQHALNALGAGVPVTGAHNQQTAAALSKFQAVHGLPATGHDDPQTREALQGALATVAGGHANVGQSAPVQAAQSAIAIGTSPLGQSILSSGLGALTSLFSADPPDGPASVTPSASPTLPPAAALAPPTDKKPAKDAICRLQNALNDLGASPPLKPTCDLDAETVAALKAFQITFGLVADGVPGPKTVAAIVVAKDPVVHDIVVPSIAKAADHVTVVAASAPEETKVPLTVAATNLKAAAVNPAPSNAETHASTASAMAATTATSAPPEVAVPVAKAAASLAAASNPVVPAPTALSDAATHLATAAAGTTGAPAASLQAAADHVSAAAAAPNADKQAEHLNAAATHLGNAATGVVAPAVAASGEFDGAQGGFGWDPLGQLAAFWHRHFARLTNADHADRMNSAELYHHHRRHFAYMPQPMIGHHRHAMFMGDVGFGVAPPRAYSNSPRGGGGGGGYGRGDGRDRDRRRDWRRRQELGGQGGGQTGPDGDGGDGGGDDDNGDNIGWGAEGGPFSGAHFGVSGPTGQTRGPLPAGTLTQGGRVVGFNPNVHYGQFSRPGAGTGIVMPGTPIGVPRPGAPTGQTYGGRNDSAYWAARQQAYRHDDREAWDRRHDRDGGGGWPGQGMHPQYDPNAVNQYQDPNAADPTVQDPSLDAVPDNSDGATDDSNS